MFFVNVNDISAKQICAQRLGSPSPWVSEIRGEEATHSGPCPKDRNLGKQASQPPSWCFSWGVLSLAPGSQEDCWLGQVPQPTDGLRWLSTPWPEPFLQSTLPHRPLATSPHCRYHAYPGFSLIPIFSKNKIQACMGGLISTEKSKSIASFLLPLLFLVKPRKFQLIRNLYINTW